MKISFSRAIDLNVDENKNQGDLDPFRNLFLTGLAWIFTR